MFTFSEGFEAATLKIPNKESNAYSGSNLPASIPPSTTQPPRVNGFPPGAYTSAQGFPGEPFGSDPAAAGWPPGAHPDEHFARHGEQAAGPGAAMPPRKQIIGFAKFKTRVEALAARDVLQGRRVDIEKGAVLKAEMAKKNLHTKRGVGPLGLTMALVGSGATVGPDTLAGLAGINGLVSPPALGNGEALSQRERELGALGAMGLAGTGARNRERPDEVEEKLRRATLTGPVVGLPVAAAGAAVKRDDEDHRRRRETDAARHAFNSVPSQVSRAPTNQAVVSPTEPSGLTTFPFPPPSAPVPTAVGGQSLQSFTSHDVFAPVGTSATWGLGPTKPDRFMSSRPTGAPAGPNSSAIPQSPPLAESNVAAMVGSSAIPAGFETNSQIYSPPHAQVPLPALTAVRSGRAYSPPGAEFSHAIDQRSVPTSSGSSVVGSGSDSGDFTRMQSIPSRHDATSPTQPASPSSGASSATQAMGQRVTDQNPPVSALRFYDVTMMLITLTRSTRCTWAISQQRPLRPSQRII